MSAGDETLAKTGRCPRDMATIDDLFCVDRYGASPVELLLNGDERLGGSYSGAPNRTTSLAVSFGARLALAFSTFFRILLGRLPEPTPAELPPAAPKQDPHELREAGALLLLSLLQREGRLVDFAMQDVAAFSDADVGVAARVVHDGCRKALSSHATIVPVRDEEEGSRVTVESTGPSIALVGNVTGKGPFAGTLRHKGWRATKLTLPEPTQEHEPTLIAPAEIEI